MALVGTEALSDIPCWEFCDTGCGSQLSTSNKGMGAGAAEQKFNAAFAELRCELSSRVRTSVRGCYCDVLESRARCYE